MIFSARRQPDSRRALAAALRAGSTTPAPAAMPARLVPVRRASDAGTAPATRSCAAVQSPFRSACSPVRTGPEAEGATSSPALRHASSLLSLQRTTLHQHEASIGTPAAGQPRLGLFLDGAPALPILRRCGAAICISGEERSRRYGVHRVYDVRGDRAMHRGFRAGARETRAPGHAAMESAREPCRRGVVASQDRPDPEQRIWRLRRGTFVSCAPT
jgi:hypothetical protein